MSDVLRLQPEDSSDRDDRFHRFKLIGWWDQNKLSRAKVLVIGAGALGMRSSKTSPCWGSAIY